MFPPLQNARILCYDRVDLFLMQMLVSIHATVTQLFLCEGKTMYCMLKTLIDTSVLISALNLTRGRVFNACVTLRSTRLSPFMKFPETLLTSTQSNTVCLQIRPTIWPRFESSTDSLCRTESGLCQRYVAEETNGEQTLSQCFNRWPEVQSLAHPDAQ